MSVKRLAQTVVEFVLDNLALLLTISFAGYVIYRQKIAGAAVSEKDLLSAILAVLALLSISFVVERYRKLNKIEEAVNRSLTLQELRSADRASATTFFSEQPDLKPYVRSANQIDLCGVTLTATIKRLSPTLAECLEAGARIRIVVIDPDSGAPTMSAGRSQEGVTADYYRGNVETTFRDVGYLLKRWEDAKAHKDGTVQTGSLSVRLMSYAPSYGIITFDAHRDNGMAFIEVYPHVGGDKLRPAFDLNRQRDGRWFEYFVEQFDQMFDAAKPWQPSRLSKEVPED